MNRRSVFLALCLASAPAAAQPVVDRVLRAPAAPPESPTHAGETLLAPPPPEVPAALAARVARMENLVEETNECFTFHGERDSHIADARCPAWLGTLAHGGTVSAHAIGRMLLADFRNGPNDVDYTVAGPGPSWTRPRLTRLLRDTDPSLAVTYLTRYLVLALETPSMLGDDTPRAALDTLADLSGEDLTAVAPWEPEMDVYRDRTRMNAVVQRWLAWARDVEPLPRDERRALAVAHNLAALRSDDAIVRFAALRRLGSDPAQRPAVLASLREILAVPTLDARARVEMQRWARRQRLAVSPARSAPAS